MRKSALMHSRMLVTYFGHHRYGQLILLKVYVKCYVSLIGYLLNIYKYCHQSIAGDCSVSMLYDY